jgi:hypothetical protein
MVFDYPLTLFDSTRIELVRMAEEDTTRYPVRDFHFVQDTLNRRKYQLRATWERGNKYELLIPAGVFANVAKEQNDTIKASYTASDPEKYAIVNVKVRSTKDRARYILQITNAQGKVQKQIFGATTGSYRFEYVSPGDIMLRVVEDMNGNGKWDTGDMVAMRQPERSEIYKNEDGVEIITTKENWEFDVDVDMDKLFAPITMESVVEMLNNREDERLKKLSKELEEKRKQEANRGHNHGGQIRVRDRGLFASGGGFLPKYHRGVFDDRLVVTAGCSNTVAMPRINNPRELVIINLIPEKK